MVSGPADRCVELIQEAASKGYFLVWMLVFLAIVCLVVRLYCDF